MPKKALCVGCNYPGKTHGLFGAVNDAFLLADCLQRNCGFEPDDVCVLHDVYPGQEKSSQHLIDSSKKPTRSNILYRLQELVKNARAGDVLFFSFSGYGLQIDDLTSPADQGFEEAILPTDFAESRGDYTVICSSDIHDILMGAPQNCSVTVLMDCNHATSIIDVSGTLDGRVLNGLKFRGLCGPQAHAAKMFLSPHDHDVWQEERARKLAARPRFQPMVEISNSRKEKIPTRLSMSRSTPVAFCYSAAGQGQTALELQLPSIVDGAATPKQHGALTWCFARALEDCKYQCTHVKLLDTIKRHLRQMKQSQVPRMDQEVFLTFSVPLSDARYIQALQPVCPLTTSKLPRQAVDHWRTETPRVVPPPPPGFITRSGEDRTQEMRHTIAAAGVALLHAIWLGRLDLAELESEDVEPGSASSAGEAASLRSSPSMSSLARLHPCVPDEDVPKIWLSPRNLVRVGAQDEDLFTLPSSPYTPVRSAMPLQELNRLPPSPTTPVRPGLPSKLTFGDAPEPPWGIACTASQAREIIRTAL